MQETKIDLGSLRVAKPCHVPWSSMQGDERVRRCGECELNVYNTSEMTKREVVYLIAKRDGRLCIRLHRRADGTLLTKDCPIGLRAYRKRAARLVTAAAAAVLGLFSVSFGQKGSGSAVPVSKPIAVANVPAGGALAGTVVDPMGAVIPNATLLLFKEGKKESIQVSSDANGLYVFSGLAEGVYRIEVTAGEFFKKAVVENVRVIGNKELTLNVTLEPSGVTVVVGIFAEEPMIDLSVSGPTPTRISREMIDRIPGRRPF